MHGRRRRQLKDQSDAVFEPTEVGVVVVLGLPEGGRVAVEGSSRLFVVLVAVAGRGIEGAGVGDPDGRRSGRRMRRRRLALPPVVRSEGERGAEGQEAGHDDDPDDQRDAGSVGPRRDHHGSVGG